MDYEAAIMSKWTRIKNSFPDDATFNKAFDEEYGSLAAGLMFTYAKFYQQNPRAFLSSFIKYNSIKYAALCIIENCIKSGYLQELEGQKDFKEWVNKQKLEDKWKPVLEKFLLILWGCIK